MAEGGPTSLSFLEDDDFDEFQDENWGKESMQLPEDAAEMWDDVWQIPNDELTMKLKALMEKALTEKSA